MFLIDGSNHAFRVQYALPPMNASDGFPTRALYGFTNLFAKILREHEPDYVVVSFDKGKTFRHEMYDEYKGHRPDMPDDLRMQWPHFPELVEAFGYACIMKPGYEADDVLGTLAKQNASADLKVFLVTGDKDLWQLVDDNIEVLDLQRNREVDTAKVIEEFGVPPDKVVDIKGLAGDSSDNIPGVPGIGPKKASAYIQKYGTVEGVIEHADDVGGKTGQKIKEHAEAARISRQLAIIKTDIDLGVDLEDLRPRGMQEDELRDLFDKWDFGQVARKLLPDKPVLEPETYVGVKTLAQLEQVLADVRQVGRVAIDLETSGGKASESSIQGYGLSTGSRTAFVPLHGRFGVELTHEQGMHALRALCADARVGKIGHGTKHAWHLLRRHDVDLVNIAGDSELADYVLVSHENHGLQAMASRYLGHTLTMVEGLDDLFAGLVSIEEVTRSVGERANIVWVLHDKLTKRMTKGSRTLYEEIELPLLPILANMESLGIRLDKDLFATIEADIEARVALAEKACHDALGRPFNVNSRNELQAVLFDELGLTSGKKVKGGGFSTDASVLEQIEEEHELPGLILAYRKLTKLLSTYVKTLPEYVAADGRIHTTFAQTVAATGRLSSNDPNLQNIPIRTFEGRRLRDGFVPDEGCVFLSADYSQIELRVLAHFVGDGPLVESFKSGNDIHARTASEVFKVAPEDVTIDLRSAAKAINFGLLYGMSAFRLGRDLGISRAEAQHYMDEYFGRMPQVKGWIDDTKNGARKLGYVETLFGRRRLIPQIHSKRFNERSAAEREAVNTPVQGTAADLIKLAMIKVDGALRSEGLGARILLQVHDELLLEVPEAEVEAVQALVIREMMGAADLIVPLAVNTAVGKTWNQAHG